MSDDEPVKKKIGSAWVTAEASDDGKDILIRVKLENKIETFQQLQYIIDSYLSQADFKYVEKTNETLLH